jgi:6-pyruvoyltetrahydropterin/6-carboxytetrahydropterin synthase
VVAAGRFRIVLAKEDFKFSAAHFTLFADGRAETLHGHNYRVRVELGGAALDELGLLADLESCKRTVRRLCRQLDSRTLLPTTSERLRCTRQGERVEVRFDQRHYSFPLADVVLLSLANTSIELLALLFWRDLAPELRDAHVDVLAVAVEESAGQSCWYEAPITTSAPGPSS